jgi:hypothetical protein
MENISPFEFAKEQLEKLTTVLVNVWLLQQKDSTPPNENKQEIIIKQFCNLSIQALYQMLCNDILIEPNTYAEPPVAQEMVRKCLLAANYEALNKTSLPDDFMDKTNVRKWMAQKEKEGIKLSGRLFSVLEGNANNWECIEYITRQSFARGRGGGESAWKEFIALRGY